MSYASLEFVEELEKLEPFGNGNPKPLFAQKQVTFLKGRLLGQNQNVGKYTVADEDGREFEISILAIFRHSMNIWIRNLDPGC